MGIRGLLGIVRWHSGGAVASLQAFCPACDFCHSFNVDLDGNGKHQKAKSPVWTFNGDYDRPTFRASMLANKDKRQEQHPVCHSFLTDGVWEYLGDCTHAMAGQKVPVPPLDPDMTFQRRHGWHLYPWCDPVTGEPKKEARSA